MRKLKTSPHVRDRAVVRALSLYSPKAVCSLVVVAMLAFAGVGLSACGNKGSLYLPDKAEQPATDEKSRDRSKKKH